MAHHSLQKNHSKAFKKTGKDKTVRFCQKFVWIFLISQKENMIFGRERIRKMLQFFFEFAVSEYQKLRILVVLPKYIKCL